MGSPTFLFIHRTHRDGGRFCGAEDGPSFVGPSAAPEGLGGPRGEGFPFPLEWLLPHRPVEELAQDVDVPDVPGRFRDEMDDREAQIELKW